MNQKADFKSEFKKLVRDPELFNEIKLFKRHANEIINRFKY